MDEPCCVHYELKKLKEESKKGPPVISTCLQFNRRCLQYIRSLEREVYVTQRQMETRLAELPGAVLHIMQEIHTFSFDAHSPLPSDKEEEERLEQQLTELEAGLEAAKDDLSVATMNLRAMIRAFKESRLLPQPGQFAGELTHSLSLIVDSIITLECDHHRITYISLNGI